MLLVSTQVYLRGCIKQLLFTITGVVRFKFLLKREGLLLGTRK